MAVDKKVTEEDDATALDGSELIRLVQAGASKKTLISAIKAYIASSDRLLAQDNTSVTISGVTGEQVVASVLIPAGTIQAHDVLRAFVTTTKSGANSTWSLNYRIHTSPTAGGNQLATVFPIVTNVWTTFLRNLIVKGTAGSQEGGNNGAAIFNDEGASVANAISTFSIDFSVDQYFVVTVGPTNSATSLTLRSFQLKLLRK